MQGLGVQGSGFRVQGLGFRVSRRGVKCIEMHQCCGSKSLAQSWDVFLASMVITTLHTAPLI